MRPDHKILLEVAGHDLRSPLNGILATAQFLLDDAAPSLSEEHIKLLQSIVSSSQKMFASIDDFLELCALESGNATLDQKPTDIGALIERNLAMSPLPADRKELRVDLARGESLPLIEVDSARMSRVFGKLLKNMIEGCGSGSNIVVSVRVANGNVVISLRAAGANDSSDESRPIHQELNGKNESIEATTLAFRLSKRILERHGGTIRADYSDEGCTYTLMLPTSVAPER